MLNDEGDILGCGLISVLISIAYAAMQIGNEEQVAANELELHNT